MPIFKQKSVIKSYKSRLQEKFKSVVEETENATAFLNNCVDEFRSRVQHILEIKDEKCLSLYRKLIRDLENYSEKIYILQASLEEVTEEETDSSGDETSENAPKDQQISKNSTPDFQIEDNINLEDSTEQNVVHHTYPKQILDSSQNVNLANIEKDLVDVNIKSEENLNLQTSVDEKNLCRYLNENLKFNSCSQDDGSSVTEDDFYSLHSDNNILNNVSNDTPFEMYDNQSISVSDYASNDYVSANSQNSCYRSISSNLSESLSFYKDSKSFHSFKTHSLENDQKCSAETSEIAPEIFDIEFEISSTFSATLSRITDPSDFWIQIENSRGSELRFSKSEYGHLSSLSYIRKGMCCLAPFKSTPFYYRARSFSNTKSGEDTVKVLFIDHGSYQDVPLKDLRPLPKSSFEIPAQAINCYLYGIASTSDSWSYESIERFREFQNYCIETVVKSRELAYGVQLTAKLSAESFSDDFSVDVAQALCLDGFAISLNESVHTDNQINQCTSQYSRSEFNKTDSSLEVSGSYDINAISSDSGVSVTSAYKSSQIATKRNEIISQVSRECTSPVAGKRSPLLYDANLNRLDHNLHMQNLISFDSFDPLNETEAKITSEKTFNHCLLCNNDKFCLHLQIPSPSLVYVEKDMVVVMLSHIVNPHEFYVNMAMENIITLDDLREQMTLTYRNDISIPCIKIQELVENMFCAGRYDADNYWYRVKILKTDTEDMKKDEILGQYVDYGNTAKIKYYNLRPLTQEFAKHPCFAIKCSLAGVRPVQDSPLVEHSNWSEQAIKVFKELTSYERCLTAQICDDLCKDDVYSVLLWDTDNSKDLLINASLADNKVAVFDSRLLQAPSSNKTFSKASIDSWNPMMEEFIDSQNNYAFDDEDIEVVTTGYHAKDEQYTCKYFSLRGYCPRGSNCPYEHLPLLESGITRDQEEIYCFDTTAIDDNVNNVLVQVSAIISPLNFYVVLPFGCKNVDDLDNLVYNGVTYDQISNSEAKALFYALDKHYSNSPFQENTTIALSCGTIVAAKRKFDGKWHRGRVVDVIDINKPAKIFFLDSGDQEWVSRKFIRTILPQFLHTPFQAMQCSLNGIEPVGTENGLSWSSDALSFFSKIVSKETLLAEIVQRFGDAYQVHLRKTTKNDHTSIAERLVAAGYAQYRKVSAENSQHDIAIKQTEPKQRKVIYVPG